MKTEKRLIDANGSYTLNECNETGHSLCFGGGFIDVYDPKGKHICQFWAGDAPTVDAVEVVRCKDCRGWCRNVGIKDSPNGHCFTHDIDTNGFDFCSYGERRNDG